jgi:hypothetical protein
MRRRHETKPNNAYIHPPAFMASASLKREQNHPPAHMCIEIRPKKPNLRFQAQTHIPRVYSLDPPSL